MDCDLLISFHPRLGNPALRAGRYLGQLGHVKLTLLGKTYVAYIHEADAQGNDQMWLWGGANV